MLPAMYIQKLVAKQLQTTILGCLKLQPCRNYSSSHILKKIRRLSSTSQLKDGSQSSSSIDRSQQIPSVNVLRKSVLRTPNGLLLSLQHVQYCSDSKENPKDAAKQSEKGKTVNKESTFLPGTMREPFLGKDILRKIKKKQTEQYFIYTENNFMDVESAMKDYLLEKSDFEGIMTFKRKSPFSARHHAMKEEEHYLECAFTKDIEKKAVEKWGSMDRLVHEKKLRRFKGWSEKDGPHTQDATFYQKLKQAFGRDSGGVVIVALVMNLCNACFKGAVWSFTGSPSMFSEFMHSVGDTTNQLLLSIGRYLSLQKPDANHPYGYRNHIHIWSILSGVFIFSLGCGVTGHSGILSLMYPVVVSGDQLFMALCVLAGTFVTEAASLSYAVLEIRKNAMAAGMSMWSYVKDGDDPLCNVVLMEDLAGVLGVLVCGASMTGSYLLGMPVLDAIGSLVISAMMGVVSAFLFKTNMDKLVGKAIPYEDKIKEELQKDRFVQVVWDPKSQDFGDQSRFKSEVVLDAKLVASHYLDTEVDIDALFVKWQSVKTTEDMNLFLEDFGVNFYNQIVAHVDRKEQDIKVILNDD
ncbi:hypothetical protein ACF0H5_011468 [Mactra antiquata]